MSICIGNMVYDYNTLTILYFKDNIKVFYFDSYRKQHVAMKKSTVYNITVKYRNVVQRELNVTYKAWNNRWCK